MSFSLKQIFKFFDKIDLSMGALLGVISNTDSVCIDPEEILSARGLSITIKVVKMSNAQMSKKVCITLLRKIEQY